MLKREEVNIFKGIFSNWIFWLICFLTFFGEMAFVELGGSPCRVAPLPVWMHLLALLLGMMSWVFCLVNKMLPSSLVYVPNWLVDGENKKDGDITIESQKDNLMGSLRKSFDLRTGKQNLTGSKKIEK